MQSKPHTIYYNGLIRTMNPAKPLVEVVGVKDGKIISAGGNEILNRAEGDTLFHNLEGKVLMPGFIDSHQHLMSTGLYLGGVDFSRKQDLGDILDEIRSACEKSPPGTMIRGYSLHEINIKERRLPSIEEIDAIAPNHMVILFHVSCHVCVVNTLMFKLLDLPPNLKGTCCSGGRFNGRINAPEITAVEKRLADIISDAERLRAIQKAVASAVASGITTLHCLDGGESGERDVPLILALQTSLPARTLVYTQTMNINEVQHLDLPRIGGCILVDGAIETRTAALDDSYCDEPGNKGQLYYSDGEMREFILKAHLANLQIAIHAIGDRAIEQVLRSFEYALNKYPRQNHGHRIEHVELPRPDQLERIAALEIAVTVQPMFIPVCAGGTDLGFFRDLLGEKRINRFHPYRQLHDSGILVAGGSDSPVTPYAPLESIRWAMQHPIAENRTNIAEGFRLFTTNAAKAGLEADRKGTIEPGKYADFVVLSEDPWKVNKSKFANIEVEATIVGGEVVYEKGKEK